LSRGDVAAAERRQLELFGADRRVLRVEAWLTEYELTRLDLIASRLGASREEAVRESIGWLAARHSLWASRGRANSVAAVVRAAEEWDPLSDHLAGAAGWEEDAARSARPGARSTPARARAPDDDRRPR
jgi:hypothetical protein